MRRPILPLIVLFFAAGFTGSQTPVAPTDGEIVTFVQDLPPGSMFTDNRGVIYMRCKAGTFSPQWLNDGLQPGRVLCVVASEEGQGTIEELDGEAWAWPAIGKLTVKTQPRPAPWNAEEAAARTAAARGAKP